MNEIFKYLKHLTREILIYWLSGFLILINIFIIDYFYYDESILNFIELRKDLLSLFTISLIFVSYILGQICMGIGYVILEKTGLEKSLKKCTKIEDFEIKGVLEKLYKNDKEHYEFFIERYDNLSYMRWNLSIALLIIFIINLIFIFKFCYWQILLLTILSIFFSIITYVLYLKTEIDLQVKIKMLTDSDADTSITN